MADIFYTFEGSAYANLTNKCCCNCSFCIRNGGDSVGSAETLWYHGPDPDLDTIMSELKEFHLEQYPELVFCGYGEPTYALDNMIAVAKYVKATYGIPTRLNTNGLGCLIHKKDIVPLLADCIDTISISLNAKDAETYDERCNPAFPGAYEEILRFVRSCKGKIDNIVVSVVDIIPEEEVEACREIADELGVTYRVRNYS